MTPKVTAFSDQKTMRHDRLSELDEAARRNYDLCRMVEGAGFRTAITFENSGQNRELFECVINKCPLKGVDEVLLKQSGNDLGFGTDLVLIDGSPSGPMKELFLAIGEAARKEGRPNPAKPAIRTPSGVQYQGSRLVFIDERFLPIIAGRWGKKHIPYVGWGIGRNHAHALGLSGATFEQIGTCKLDGVPAAECLLVHGYQELGKSTVWRAHKMLFTRSLAKVDPDEVVKTEATDDLVAYIRKNLRYNHPINLRWLEGNLEKQVAFMLKGNEVADEALADAF